MAYNVPGFELTYEESSSIYVHDLDLSCDGINTGIRNTSTPE